MKKSQIVVCIIIFLGIFGVIGLYSYEVFFLKKHFTENLARYILILLSLIGTFTKCLVGAARKPLEFYAKAYDEEIRYAFKDNLFARKKLLCALRLYNEQNYRKTLKYLMDLTKEIKNEHDAFPVYVFAAKCYSNLGIHNEAIKIYYQLLKYVPSNPTVHSNLGYEYMEDGDYELAMQHIDEAIRLDPYYHSAYLNKANCYFFQHDFDNTIEFAKKALELKNNDDNSSGLLAITYAILGDKENKEKYFHLAIANGKPAEDLNRAIEHYMTQKAESQENEQEKNSLN